MNSNTIIIAGPEGVGKSCVCKHLAFRLDLPVISLDEERATKLNLSMLSKLRAIAYSLWGGFWKVYNFIKPYEFTMVEKILKETEEGVIDMGAGSIIYHTKHHHDKMKDLLSNFQFIFLLLPNKNKELSLKYLNHINTHLSHIRPNVNEYFLDFPYEDMVKYVIYTKNRTVSSISREIEEIITEKRVAII